MRTCDVSLTKYSLCLVFNTYIHRMMCHRYSNRETKNCFMKFKSSKLPNRQNFSHSVCQNFIVCVKTCCINTRPIVDFYIGLSILVFKDSVRYRSIAENCESTHRLRGNFEIIRKATNFLLRRSGRCIQRDGGHF